MTITILGLGPGSPRLLTQEAWELLSETEEVYLRTSRHPTVAAFPERLVLHDFDHLYETLDSFELVYETIAEQIIELGRRPQGVIYAVPGHPLVGESSVSGIRKRAVKERLAVRIVEGLSFVEPVLSLLGIDGLDGLQLADATDLAAAHHPALDPDRPAIVGQLYGQRLASELKLTLMNAYPDDHTVILVCAAGTEAGNTKAIPLYALDRGQEIDHLTSLYVPPLPFVSGLPSFQATVARLRAPDGCPWDQEQTHQSLRASVLEEAYEVLAALDAGSSDKLCEELGDLLMQVAMHVQIATEEGSFRFADVIGQIDAKLKRRHPHVFGDVKVRDTGEVLRNWEAIKASERAEAGHAHHSRLESVPTILPALARAQALGERSVRDGFDHPDIARWIEHLAAALEKVTEEAAEFRTAGPQEQMHELGDLLFALANAARHLGMDAESALRTACDRFTSRYAEMERLATAQHSTLRDLSSAEKQVLWARTRPASCD